MMIGLMADIRAKVEKKEDMFLPMKNEPTPSYSR
jgi:hypothetical protein